MVQMLREDFINDGYLTTILGVEQLLFFAQRVFEAIWLRFAAASCCTKNKPPRHFQSSACEICLGAKIQLGDAKRVGSCKRL
jgi:hypothetical protein